MKNNANKHITRLLGASLIAFSATMAADASAGAIYAFTSAGATGMSGPSQAQLNSAYANTTLNGAVTALSTGIQQWSVPMSGLYTITVSGASGGSTLRAAGGRGATMQIQQNLIAGDVMQILVGLSGGAISIGSTVSAGGGGGGTFIYDATRAELVAVAGGGGGAAQGSGSWNYALAGKDAAAIGSRAGTDGSSSAGSWSVAGIGGTNGSGGVVSTAGQSGGGGGGGGFSGNGGSATYGGKGGVSFTNGGKGGFDVNQASTQSTGSGGFGGGGGAGVYSNFEAIGGGGGGYSGGGGGNTRVGSGGGGGNFYSGLLLSNGFNIGNGNVTFELMQTVPEPGSFALFALSLATVVVMRRRGKR